MSSGQQKSLLEAIDWTTLDIRVSRQQRNREVHAPAISLFRWWARRPHALIGEILDAAPPGSRISDPFSGGGTVAIEAAQRGLGIYAQDLHPWATTGLATALDRVDARELARAGEAWSAALEHERRRLYGDNRLGADVSTETLTTFWVRTANCPACDTLAHLYPYSLISIASRRSGETHGYFGCNACGAITRSSLNAHARRCSDCRRRLPDPGRSQIPGGLFTCRAANCRRAFRAFGSGYSWRPVLLQRLRDGQAQFELPTVEDLDLAQLDPPELPAPLAAEIPPGLETRRLRGAGITRWADLYPGRQLCAMLNAAAALEELELDEAIRARLRLVLAGASEMAGYASRWDRYYPKAFELTANHRFSVTGLAAEVNLLATRGRGTLPRRIAQTVRAAQWAQGFPSSVPRKLRASAPRLAACEDAVVQGSSTRQLLPDSSIDLVLTDPPYFDDVQYAELGSMFLVWAQAIGLIPKSVHVDLRSEAVPNTVRGVTGERYRHILTAVLRETRRTLRPSGRMVLTFHNTDGHAWWALARALGNAGFHVSALAVAHAENETDHSKRGRRAFSHDLVLECRPQPVAEAEIVIAASPKDPQARELLAAGRTVAQLAGRLADGRATRASSYRTFSRSYRQHLGEPAGTYIHFAAPRTKTAAHR